MNWMSLFIQRIPDETRDLNFIKGAQIMDLCTLDVDFATYPPDVVAVAVLFYIYDEDVVKKMVDTEVMATNNKLLEIYRFSLDNGQGKIDWKRVNQCRKWMHQFYQKRNQTVSLDGDIKIQTWCEN
jgi:hypothetical protein